MQGSRQWCKEHMMDEGKLYIVICSGAIIEHQVISPLLLYYRGDVKNCRQIVLEILRGIKELGFSRENNMEMAFREVRDPFSIGNNLNSTERRMEGVIWMIDAKASPFFMLDGTLEYQKEIVDKFASGLPLESVAEYFERNGIKMPDCQNDVEMRKPHYPER